MNSPNSISRTAEQGTWRLNVREHECAGLLERRPTDPLYLYKLANLCRERGDLHLWRSMIDVAFALDHETHEQIYHRAAAKLTLGDWSGWVDRQARQFKPRERSKSAPMLRWRHRAWNGQENIENKVLFVYLEQGFGDGIQMLRYVPMLADRARRVLMAVRPGLVDLVRHNFGSRVTVSVRGTGTLPRFDRYVCSMALPALIGGLPPFVPLGAPAASRQASDGSRAKIGLCWAGGAANSRDRRRSMPIAALAPLLTRTDVEYYSLQVGAREADAGAYGVIKRPLPPLRSFADTASLVVGLDCVISVDTAVCHLAGSLGVPTLLILPFVSEWRWGLGSSTPWYPTMRLIRQAYPGDWPSAVEEVVRQVDALMDHVSS